MGGQQIGDQIAAQHEEDVNTEGTSRRHAHAGMEGDNGEHRKRPDAVETGNPAAPVPDLARTGLDRCFILSLPQLPGLVCGRGRAFLRQFL
jgi:hypothetical protein